MTECKDTACPLVPRIEAAVALIEERMSQIKADTEEIKEAVQEMKDKPAKRWDGIVEKAIWAIIAAVIAFLLARVGLV